MTYANTHNKKAYSFNNKKNKSEKQRVDIFISWCVSERKIAILFVFQTYKVISQSENHKQIDRKQQSFCKKRIKGISEKKFFTRRGKISVNAKRVCAIGELSISWSKRARCFFVSCYLVFI